MNKVYIQCGISEANSGAGPRATQQQTANLCALSIVNKSSRFWPVLQATPLHFSWPYNFNHKFSLIFTSKFAVNYYVKKYLQSSFNPSQFLHLEHICAVGPSTAQEIQKEMIPKLFKELDKSVLYPKEEGLYNLLTQTNFAPQSHLYIFTAFNGKTAETLQQISQKKMNVICKMIPVYQLEPCRSDFLEKVFPPGKMPENFKYIFCCRSGLVLKTVIEHLKNYFDCKDAHNLPAYIYFSVTKQSTKNEIQALDLIDRISS